MIRYFLFEVKITAPFGILIVAALCGTLRLAQVLSPGVPEVWAGWVSFAEVVLPVLFPLLAFTLLEKEKGWRTLEVLAATPRRKAAVFFVRYLIVLLAFMFGVVAAVQPGEYLLLLAPGLALGGMALLAGLTVGEETGLGLSLGWWGMSFALSVAGSRVLAGGILSWILLVLSSAPLSPAEVVLRKWAQLGTGVLLLLVSLAALERKRGWRVR